MQVHAFDTESLPDVPWKNGRGTTREIACWPAGSDLGSFHWRASIATIAASAPFSTFAGVDRTIVLLSGRGVHLRSADRSIDHRLDNVGQPFSFAGERAIDCESLGTVSRDFNVMTRRGVHHAETRVVRAEARLEPAPFGLLLALHGTWQVAGAAVANSLDPGHGLWWEEGEGLSWSFRPDPAHGHNDSALIAVRWTSASTQSA
ncbi:MAG TPA: HutD family protein [Steroidobacteraceae bacterium]